MKPKISLITLGVRDLKAATAFYKKLGFPVAKESNEHITFLTLEGTWLGLFPREELAKDAMVDAEGTGFKSFTLAHNVGSPEAVEAVLKEAVAAGGKLEKKARKAEWGGFSGYFRDPDGFLWEVAHNPFMDLT